MVVSIRAYFEGMQGVLHFYVFKVMNGSASIAFKHAASCSAAPASVLQPLDSRPRISGPRDDVAAVRRMIHSILFTRGSGDLIKDGSRANHHVR